MHYTRHAYQLNMKAIDYEDLSRRIIRYSCAVSNLPRLSEVKDYTACCALSSLPLPSIGYPEKLCGVPLLQSDLSSAPALTP